ncbi:hypothetical protein [Cellvibrio japonicus]|uniref:Lipoprotein n=1 Tax=Cellvibrio japonicus (strain Ueda107) TaxID=498211 RepID=B3PIM6_CELJU|nr:hypothetical protein [Cellvibrio japonicus]ACE86365.1 hypothetical protein CJA_3758 [Cellvibrio japonicus Ueda107]QEI13947.1 hypothetical protein FY117_18125 [Cellvibrio japonicus]QEI17521.1 hypothetical protein FY116_18130 [Cellvibrio japonicus]QEI21097.1 hypothetical protein FY115_18125 [Cellvibrio japonicus]
MTFTKRPFIRCGLLASGALSLLMASLVQADEWQISLGTEVRYFPGDGLYENAGDRWAFNLEVENHWSVLNDSDYPLYINLHGQFRQAAATADDDRNRVDFPALNLAQFRDGWEWTLGMDKLFWGVAESQNLVNIVNQTDLQASPDGKDRLGQWMARTSWHHDTFGSWDFLLLPHFRARDFSNSRSRLALPLPVLGRDAYESGDGDNHLDFASRWSHQWGDLTTGLSYFNGTSRAPDLQLVIDNTHPSQPLVLQPFYAQIEHTGFDAQWILGEWLLKAEAIYQTSHSGHYWASISGVEYTFGQIMDTSYDLSWYLEYLYDDRQAQAPAGVLENDWMLAARLSFNDEASSSLLVAVFRDAEADETIVKCEGSYRLSDHLSLGLELWTFATGPSYSRDPVTRIPAQIVDTATYGKQALLNDEDFLQLSVTYYF